MRVEREDCHCAFRLHSTYLYGGAQCPSIIALGSAAAYAMRTTVADDEAGRMVATTAAALSAEAAHAASTATASDAASDVASDTSAGAGAGAGEEAAAATALTMGPETTYGQECGDCSVVLVCE